MSEGKTSEGEEAAKRRDEALKRALKMPPKLHKPTKSVDKVGGQDKPDRPTDD